MGSTRPKLADVSDWRIHREMSNAKAEVQYGTLLYQGQPWQQGAFSVKDLKTGKRKVFYGETAWSDAERYASDLLWAR